MFAHFEIRSAVVAYCLGMVITLGTVVKFSASAVPLAWIMRLTDEFIGVLADEDVQEEVLNAVSSAKLADVERQASTLFAGLAEFRVVPVKKRILDEAALVGSVVTSIFIVMGLFSIMVGVLLIFLIFVMLAAARRSEMARSALSSATKSPISYDCSSPTGPSPNNLKPCSTKTR